MKIFLTILVLLLIPLALISYNNNEPNAYRGCVASAYQADARGSAGSTLEDNLAYCDQL